MKLAITGLNHRTAPVEVREKLAISESALDQGLIQLREQAGVSEALILSTCNRVEVAISVPDGHDPRQPVVEFLTSCAASNGLRGDALNGHLYTHEGVDAVRHLFRVASSLDSMVIGEPQILGQLKSAYSAAKERGSVGGLLDSVVTRAFSVAKRVRTETEIGSSAVSVSFAAVELAREIFGGLSGQKIMLVGAGKMSTLTAKHLKGQGAAEIYITNRTYERAVELAKEFQGWIVDYENFPRSLPTVDIVIVSTGAPSYVIRKDQMRDVIRARRNRPMFLIDIAVPRQIEPAVNELDNVFLYDIDDLQQVVDRNLKGRLNAAEQAARIIDEEVGRLENRMRARGAANVIVGLQAQLEKIRAAEVERVHSKLGALTPKQEEAIEALTRGIINKVAHGAIAELRKDPEGSAELIRRVFRIEAGSEGD